MKFITTALSVLFLLNVPKYCILSGYSSLFVIAQMGKLCSLQNKLFLQCVVCDFAICCKWLLYIYYE